MTREIKFRAWNKGGQEWIDEEFSISQDGKIFFYDNGDSFDIPKEIEVMQYTGLKDKNGKEIYEGDIVKYTEWRRFHDECREIKCKVEWHEGLCGFTPMVYHTVVGDGFYNEEVEDIEIIGNIYENPDLLQTLGEK